MKIDSADIWQNTNNATYSANLAEKFRNEIKRYLPRLDMIGGGDQLWLSY